MIKPLVVLLLLPWRNGARAAVLGLLLLRGADTAARRASPAGLWQSLINRHCNSLNRQQPHAQQHRLKSAVAAWALIRRGLRGAARSYETLLMPSQLTEHHFNHGTALPWQSLPAGTGKLTNQTLTAHLKHLGRTP